MIARGDLGADSARAMLRDLLPEIKEDSYPLYDRYLDRLAPYGPRGNPRPAPNRCPLVSGAGYGDSFPFQPGLRFIVSPGRPEIGRGKEALGEKFSAGCAGNAGIHEKKGFSSLTSDLRKAFFRQDYRRFIEIAGQWTEQTVGEKGPEVRMELPLKSDLPPAANYQVLRAFKDFLVTGPEDSFKGIARATLPILSKFIELKILWGEMGPAENAHAFASKRGHLLWRQTKVLAKKYLNFPITLARQRERK